MSSVANPVLTIDPAHSRQLSARVPLTRATTANYWNYAGVLSSVASGTGRIDFDPDTKYRRGMLIEPAATNNYTYSQDFSNGVWTVINGTLTAAFAAAPDGTTSGGKYTEDATAAVGRVMANTTAWSLVSGTQYVASIYAKNGTGGSTRYVGIVLQTARYGANVSYGFTLSGSGTATVGTAGTNSSGGIQYVGNGWYRCWVSAQCTSSGAAASNVQHRIIANPASPAGSYTGDGVSNLLFWGAQYEAGTYPTSYYGTTTPAATRNADSYVATSISSYLNAVEGTLIWVGEFDGFNVSDRVVVLSDNSTANYISLQLDATTATTLVMNVMASSVSQGSVSLGTSLAIKTRYAAAIAWNANDLQGALNGTVSAIDSAATIPTGLTRLGLGDPAGSGGQNMQGVCASLRWWSKRLTAGQLAQLTAV